MVIGGNSASFDKRAHSKGQSLNVHVKYVFTSDQHMFILCVFAQVHLSFIINKTVLLEIKRQRFSKQMLPMLINFSHDS